MKSTWSDMYFFKRKQLYPGEISVLEIANVNLINKVSEIRAYHKKQSLKLQYHKINKAIILKTPRAEDQY